MGLLLNKIRTGAILSWHYITVSQLKLQFISLLIIDSKLHVLNSDLVLDIYMCDSIKYMKIVNNDYLKVSSLSHYKLDVYVNNMTFYEKKFLDFFFKLCYFYILLPETFSLLIHQNIVCSFKNIPLRGSSSILF